MNLFIMLLSILIT